MKQIQSGVNEGSEIYFSTPSKMARELLFYPIAAGISYCNEQLKVRRDRYDSSLLTFVVDGEFVLEQDGVYKAGENEILLVDCYRKHAYWTKRGATTVWVHFKGSNSKEIFSELLKEVGHHIKSEKYKYEMTELLDLIKKRKDATSISNKIYGILLMLLNEKKEANSANQASKYVEAVKDYIKKNYSRQISVKDIAGAVHISPSYLFGIYKKQQSVSPYDYLLQLRLRKAKELLRQTDLSVSEVAFQVGFGSQANFIAFFKKEVGISPLQFRKIPF